MNAQRKVRVHFADGSTIHTKINGTEQSILDYYIGKAFNLGDTEAHPKDRMVKAVHVEFLDREPLRPALCFDKDPARQQLADLSDNVNHFIKWVPLDPALRQLLTDVSNVLELAEGQRQAQTALHNALSDILEEPDSAVVYIKGTSEYRYTANGAIQTSLAVQEKWRASKLSLAVGEASLMSTKGQNPIQGLSQHLIKTLGDHECFHVKDFSLKVEDRSCTREAFFKFVDDVAASIPLECSDSAYHEAVTAKIRDSIWVKDRAGNTIDFLRMEMDTAGQHRVGQLVSRFAGEMPKVAGILLAEALLEKRAALEVATASENE